MTSKPHADSLLAKFLEKRILELKHKKTQSEIASQAGFINPNMLTMVKQGASKLPLDRVPALARALETDPKYLFRLALKQAGEATTERAIEEIFETIVTRNEIAWIEALREASDHSDPSLTARGRDAIRAVFGNDPSHCRFVRCLRRAASHCW